MIRAAADHAPVLAMGRPPLTVGSLFAGIGGFDLGLERAGMQVRWQVEIDPFCRAVLEKHWPHVRRYEDVRTVGSELEWVDVICGGFPCQDLSSAGKRAGLDGARSGLYREFMRIIGCQRPRGVLIENVHHSWRQWVPILRRALWACEGYILTTDDRMYWDRLYANLAAPNPDDDAPGTESAGAANQP